MKKLKYLTPFELIIDMNKCRFFIFNYHQLRTICSVIKLEIEYKVFVFTIAI